MRRPPRPGSRHAKRSQFVRVHRSAIVRISQLSEMRCLSNQDALLRLQDGTPLRASRTYIRQLRALLDKPPTYS